MHLLTLSPPFSVIHPYRSVHYLDQTSGFPFTACSTWYNPWHFDWFLSNRASETESENLSFFCDHFRRESTGYGNVSALVRGSLTSACFWLRMLLWRIERSFNRLYLSKCYKALNLKATFWWDQVERKRVKSEIVGKLWTFQYDSIYLCFSYRRRQCGWNSP